MKRVYKLFVESPSDLEAERREIPRIIDRINGSFGLRWNIFVQVVMWETSVHSGIGEDAQDVINRQVPEDYDVFLGMFWNRVGTKTKRAESGTLEEYERALNRHVRTGKLEIMVFFKEPEFSSQEHMPQREEMLRLRERIGRDNVMFSTFRSTPQFAEIFYDQLLMILAEFSHGTKRDRVLRSYTIGDKGQKVPVKQSANVALVHKNRVLLVKRSKRLKMGPGLWQLPGGKLEPGEVPSEAALREIQEELGLVLEEDDLQPVTSIHSQSLGDREGDPIQIHLFYYEVGSHTGHAPLGRLHRPGPVGSLFGTGERPAHLYGRYAAAGKIGEAVPVRLSPSESDPKAAAISAGRSPKESGRPVRGDNPDAAGNAGRAGFCKLGSLPAGKSGKPDAVGHPAGVV